MSGDQPANPSRPLGGRYAVRRPLGEGSFAVTYLAEDLVLGRLVAVKVLRARYGGDPAATARFEREARAAASVSSPYIVDVFDYGTDQGQAYIVLQYVPGPTLRDLINQTGRLAPREAVRIAVDILRGLAVIHDAGIVHRDVKPHNVLIDRHGTARVTDFGVALWAGSETLTTHGMAVGTAVYMAPEQARGEEVGEAADLYAVGVLLFEMLTGQPPFRADHPTTLMLAHVQQAPPLPSEIVPGLDLPVALEREVMRALAKDPRDRRRGAREMAAALEAAGAGIPFVGPVEAGSPQPGSTAAIPALVGRPDTATRADAAAVTASTRGTGRMPGRTWIGPAALLLVALVIVVLVVSNGGFGGITGPPDPTAEGPVAGLVGETPEATVTDTATAAPTMSGAAPTDAGPTTDRPLFPTTDGVASEVATIANPTPTEPPVTAPPRPSPTPPPPTESIALAPTAAQATEPTALDAESANGGEVFGGANGSTLQFGANDWRGAAPADPAFGRPAVALFGADGPSARAVLSFDLGEAPAGQMVLTLVGLGDETGMAFPFGIEVNGMYVGQSTTSFDNWHPAQDGLDGESATWDEVRIVLPPEILHAGSNEIVIVSLSPGDYDDRVPYLLLSDATLAPR